MKTTMRNILVVGMVLCASAAFGGQPVSGVAGVEVTVKENSAKRIATDARGSFVLQGLAPGSYTLVFKAQKSKDTKAVTTSTVTVAQSYSIKVDGTKRPVSRSAVSDQLLAGVAIPVQVGAGGQIRGQVAATQAQKMVWLAPELGSNIPGRWVPADSPEAKGHRGTRYMKGSDMQDMLDRSGRYHQEGFGGSGSGR